MLNDSSDKIKSLMDTVSSFVCRNDDIIEKLWFEC